MRKLIVMLIALVLCGAAMAEALTPGDYVSGYFNVVAELEVGSAGYSLKLAKAACEVLDFAAKRTADPEDEATMLAAAWDALGEERQARFAENYPEIVSLAGEAFESYEDARPLFEDAGIDEEMAALVADEAIKAQWDTMVEGTRALSETLQPE